MRQAVNQGLPLILSQPNHPLVEHFLQLARDEVSMLEPELVVEAEAPAEPVREERAKRSGLFGRLRK
jgi:hypothetical protein